MPTNVAAIRVIIKLRPNGQHDHPDWTTLPVVQAATSIKDVMLSGWFYDHVSGHTDDDADSPRGQWIGMHLVSEQFATEAITAFPALVTRVREADFADFYDSRSQSRAADEVFDDQRLTALANKRRLLADTGDIRRLKVLDRQIAKALNAEHLEPGVRRNKRKRWSSAKDALGFAIIDP